MGISGSKTDHRPWNDPVTLRGVPLRGERTVVLHVHEAGFFRTTGWNYAGVRSPFWRLYHNRAPGGWVRAAGRVWPLDPAAVLLLPEGAAFDCGAPDGVPHRWVHFSPLGTGVAEPVPLAVPVGAGLRSLLQELERALATGAGRAALLHLASAAVHGAFAGLPPDWNRPRSARLEAVCRMAEERLDAPLPNAALARAAALSPEAFVRWFRRETGTTPQVWLKERRIHEACRLLVFTERKIDDIALACGFANRHHFSRVFARMTGCGPATYRRRSATATSAAANRSAQ